MTIFPTCFILAFAGLALGACPAGWTHHGNFCYFFSPNQLDWMAARDACFAKGAYLAEPKTKGESDFLEGVTRPQNKAYWLGGIDEAEGQWAWVYSNEPFSNTYTDWFPGEPNNQNNEDCLHLFPSHQQHWNDYLCDKAQYYICEKKYSGTLPSVG